MQVHRLIDPQRSFATVLQPIFQLIRFFFQDSQSYSHLFRSFSPAVFPGLLVAYSRIFELAIDELRRRIEALGNDQPRTGIVEAVAALDRLGSYCFTGFPRSLIASVMKPLGAVESIQSGAWPYISPSMIDLRDPAGRLNFPHWPRAADGRPILMQIASVSYHYGVQVAANRRNLIWLQEMGGGHGSGINGLTHFLEDLFRDLWCPQTVAFISHQIARQIRASDPGWSTAADCTEREAWRYQSTQILDQWVASDDPFLWSNFSPIVGRFIQPSFPATTILSTQARRDYARELYQAARRAGLASSTAFASSHATWFTVLSCVVQQPRSAPISSDQWAGAISTAMAACRIECTPGVYNLRLSHRRVVRFTGSVSSAAAIMAPVGSLKRAAIEANDRAKRIKTRQQIDFGQAIPFDRVPDFIKESFQAQLNIFATGDRQVAEHYQTAWNCLDGCLGEPLCDLLFMIVLTLSLCSVTPTVPNHGTAFEPGPRKNSATFAVTLVTRMLWFLRPDQFLWSVQPHQPSSKGLPIPEMVKKLGEF